MQIRPDPIESEVIAKLEQLARDGTKNGWNDATWTRSLEQRLRELGVARGLKVYASDGSKAKMGEWLFDMSWHEADDHLLQGWGPGSPSAVAI